jgi:serine/threonine-protein kinase
MFSGKKPFSAETPVKVLFLHLEGEAEPLGSVVPGLADGVEAMVKSAMSKDPDQRPPSAQALLGLIEGIRGEEAKAA